MKRKTRQNIISDLAALFQRNKYPLVCRKTGHNIAPYLRKDKNSIGLECSRRGCGFEVDMAKPPFPSEPVKFLWAREVKS